MHKKEISKLTDNIEAKVVLAIVERDIKGIGIAATFSNVVMVSDVSKFKYLRNKFIDLQKIDSTISNPFELNN